MVTGEKSKASNDLQPKQLAVSKNEGKHFFFQPKLTIGATDDVYEREADAVADKVMHSDNHDTLQAKIMPLAIQRTCAACEEEEPIQRKDDGQNDGLEAPTLVADALGSPSNPLDDRSRSFMESRFGYDFSDVKIHTGSIAAKSAEAINALAYTSGNNVVFGGGQYQPSTNTGKKLLAHELTHVVQQRNAVAPKIQREEAVSEHSKSGISFTTPFKDDAFADTSTGSQIAGNNYWYQKIRTMYEFSYSGAFAGVTTDGMNMLLAKAWEVRPVPAPSATTVGVVSKTALLPLQLVMPKASKFFYCTFNYSYDTAKSKPALKIDMIESALQGTGKIDLDTAIKAVKVPKELNKNMEAAAGTGFPGNNVKSYFKAHPEVQESIAKYLQGRFIEYKKSGEKSDFSLKEVIRTKEISGQGSTEIQVLVDAQGNKEDGIYFIALYYTAASSNVATPDYDKKDYIDYLVEKNQDDNPTAQDKLGAINGLEAITNNNEKLIVKSTAYQLFTSENVKAGVTTKNFRDTEVDQIIPISSVPNDPAKTEYYYYTFILHKADASNVINITVKRIGKKGDAVVSDPAKTLISRVPGYYENAYDAMQVETPDKLKKWIRTRYSAVPDADITAPTVADITAKINTIIETKCQTTAWFKDNYGILILSDVEGAKRLKTIHKIPDAELVGTKNYTVAELNFIELALQRFSNELLAKFKKVNLIRQVKNLSAAFGNASGLTQQPYTYNGTTKAILAINRTITIYDTAFTDASSFMGGIEGVNASGTESLTHEFGHVIANTYPGMNVGNASYVDKFNKFYKSLSLTPVTAYAKDTSDPNHSPDTEYFPEAIMLFMSDPEWLVNNQHQTYLWFLYLQENGSPPSNDQVLSLITIWETQRGKQGSNPGAGDSILQYALWKAYAVQKMKLPDADHITTLLLIITEHQSTKKRSMRRDEINAIVTKWLAFVKTNKKQPVSAEVVTFF